MEHQQNFSERFIETSGILRVDYAISSLAACLGVFTCYRREALFKRIRTKPKITMMLLNEVNS